MSPAVGTIEENMLHEVIEETTCRWENTSQIFSDVGMLAHQITGELISKENEIIDNW